MQYILTESEYQDFLASKDKVQVLEHRLAVANEVREANRAQIKQLDGLVRQGKQSIKERDQRIADLKSSNAIELANLSLKLREAQRDMADTCSALAKANILNDSRLRIINRLQAKVRRLMDEKVYIAKNPRTGTVRVVSVAKADTYRKFGWIVSDEEFIINRPTDCKPFDWSGTPGI